MKLKAIFSSIEMRLVSLVLLVGCAKPPPHATAADAERASVALADLEEGRTLLIRKCSGCHRTPLPSEQAALAWPGKVADMVERSKIDANERALIERYLVVMAPK